MSPIVGKHMLDVSDTSDMQDTIYLLTSFFVCLFESIWDTGVSPVSLGASLGWTHGQID